MNDTFFSIPMDFEQKKTYQSGRSFMCVVLINN